MQNQYLKLLLSIFLLVPALASCAPGMDNRSGSPFADGQAWELTGTNLNTQKTEVFQILIRYVIQQSDYNPTDGDVSFLDKKSESTTNDITLIAYGIDYNPKTGFVVVGAISLKDQDNRYCIVENVFNTNATAFEGHYFVGNDSDFVTYKLKKDYSRFGKCMLAKR